MEALELVIVDILPKACYDVHDEKWENNNKNDDNSHLPSGIASKLF